LDRYNYPQKQLFLNFFLRFLGVFVPILKAKKVAHFGFSTGTKDEFRIFEEYKCNISLLVPVQSPQEIEEKNLKKVFFGIFVPVQIPYFWT
jgi:hypothetical protein